MQWSWQQSLKKNPFISLPSPIFQYSDLSFVCIPWKINAFLEKNKPLWTVESHCPEAASPAENRCRSACRKEQKKREKAAVTPGWGPAPPMRRHRFPFKMSREFPDVFQSVLVRIKRTIKWLTRVFKGTDYSSEVLEQHEKLTTFKMKSAWKKHTRD